MWTSSGTTGTPGVFVQDPTALAIYDALVSVQVDRRASALERRAARHGRAALITADSDHFAAITAWRRQAQRTALARHEDDRRDAAAARDRRRDLERHDPAFVSSYPTVLTLLAEEQNAGRLQLQLAGVWSGGEALSPTARTLVEDAFDCPVHNEYGASECLSIGYACRAGAVHVNADYVVLEPVERDDRPTPPGELSHTVLLTNLANAVQPIIRYDLGDRMRAHVGPCRCGNPLPAFELEGRADDILALRAAERRASSSCRRSRSRPSSRTARTSIASRSCRTPRTV